MSESKHTPAPWTYGFTHWGRWQIDSSKNEAGVSFHIAELASYAGLGGREKVLNDQQEANARLIAAAPRLLEALQKYVAHSPNVTLGDIERARAAITMATVT